jgi:hypothetical protein
VRLAESEWQRDLGYAVVSPHDGAAAIDLL